mmetsp:Transcript_52126/g.126363  ORF Transcript_52126/g.126363 Transcript_52126/m.126363 type:complete len:304 (-) Transcript_52126:14-925(-)
MRSLTRFGLTTLATLPLLSLASPFRSSFVPSLSSCLPIARSGDLPSCIPFASLAPPPVRSGCAGCTRHSQAGYPFVVLRQTRQSMSGGGTQTGESMDTVLRFWFGDGYAEGNYEGMKSEDYAKERAKLWWSGGAEIDKEIADRFTDLIRAASNSGLSKGEWATPNGMIARIILFDQLSRNAFRKKKEAFAYDKEAIELSRELFNNDMVKGFPTNAIHFAAMPLMHSEELKDHDLFIKGFEGIDDPIAKHAIGALEEHRAVLVKFGRYPHRNALYGRETTKEEQEWLSSPDCPAWAKSQSAPTE